MLAPGELARPSEGNMIRPTNFKTCASAQPKLQAAIVAKTSAAKKDKGVDTSCAKIYLGAATLDFLLLA
jgi:hypothetical protein